MSFRKGSHCAFVVGAFFLAFTLLCSAASAQVNDLQVAHTSQGACTAHPSAPAPSHPDLLSTPYVPPKPNSNAITAPKLVSFVDANFPADTPEGKFSGVSLVALLVGTNGKPEQVHIEKSLGPSFDKSAVAAVEQYRFDPALQLGKPVPVKVCVEVNFRRY